MNTLPSPPPAIAPQVYAAYTPLAESYKNGWSTFGLVLGNIFSFGIASAVRHIRIRRQVQAIAEHLDRLQIVAQTQPPETPAQR